MEAVQSFLLIKVSD